MFFVDLIDPFQEDLRKNLRDFALERANGEGVQHAMATLNGEPWPPIMLPGTLFPIEYDAAIDDARVTFTSLAVYDIFRYRHDTRNVHLLTYAQSLMGMDVEHKLSAAGVTLDELALQMQARVETYMHRSPGLRDAMILANLRHHLARSNRQNWHLAREAPFWHFALCIPASFTLANRTITSEGGAGIDPRARGLQYSNQAVDDIKVSEPLTQNGETFIDIVRAKVPYREERVRAFEIPEDELDAEMLVTLPRLPDLAEARRSGKATYTRADSSEVEYGFGWRDSNDADDTEVPGTAHSNWLSVVIFQRFLLALAKHPGIWRGEERAHGVFRYGDRVYMAPAPRPWHEDRFVFLDSGTSRADATGVALTEAAVHRWNEVHSNLFKAGTVPSDLLVDNYAGSPLVAVWSQEYPELATGVPSPYVLKNAVFQFSGDIESTVVRDGRLYMHTHVSTRFIQAIEMNEASQSLTSADLEAIFKTAVKLPSMSAAPIFPGNGPIGTADLQVMFIDGRRLAFLNRNSCFMNRWLPLTAGVVESGSQVQRIQIERSEVMKKQVRSYTLRITLKVPVEEVRFAQTWRQFEWDSADGIQVVPEGEQVPLTVGRVALHVDGKLQVFLNHTGDIEPGWRAVVTTGRLPTKRAMLLDSVNEFNLCNGGLSNDYSLFPAGVSDADRARGAGYHINYQDASPFVEKHAGANIPYISFRDSALHPDSGGMMKWNPDTRTCVPTDVHPVAEVLPGLQGDGLQPRVKRMRVELRAASAGANLWHNWGAHVHAHMKPPAPISFFPRPHLVGFVIPEYFRCI
jgi:hypothetical protein